MNAHLAYSVAAAAAATGLSPSHIDREIKAGRLRAKRSSVDENGDPVGRKLILAADLQAYLESLPDG